MSWSGTLKGAAMRRGYDNEWANSNRLVDVVELVANKL
jgi:hypothetical protein